MADITPRKGSPSQFALFRALAGLSFFCGFANGYLSSSTLIRWVGVLVSLAIFVGFKRRLAGAGVALLLLAGLHFNPEFPHGILFLLVGTAFLLLGIPEGEPFSRAPSRGADWAVPPVWMWLAELLFFGGGWFAAYLVYREGTSAVLSQDWLLGRVLLLGLVAVDARWIHPKFSAEPPVVFFDGVCGLCSNFVDWLFAEDANQIFRVSALQSDYAIKTLEGKYLAAANEDPSSIVLRDSTGSYNKSTAVIRIAARLGGILRWAPLFLAIPKPLRDGVYDLVAKNRYQWFGKKETCRLPTSSERSRFLM